MSIATIDIDQVMWRLITYPLRALQLSRGVQWCSIRNPEVGGAVASADVFGDSSTVWVQERAPMWG